jgi:uncharacterized protein with HEPN domain
MIQLLRRAEVVRLRPQNGYSGHMEQDRSAVAVVLQRLHDHISDAYTLTENRSPGELVADHLARLALERCVTMISEAAKRIPPDWQGTCADVPWERLARLGVLLRDPGQEVDVERLWEAVEKDIPPLEAAIGELTEMANAGRH